MNSIPFILHPSSFRLAFLMPNATLIISQPGHEPRASEISESIVSIGRAPDNTISLEGDSNVSRYHAEIETRGTEFWIVDLGSSNGTTVGGAPLEFETPLKDGDLISLGGSTQIEFLQSSPQATEPDTSGSSMDIPGGALNVPSVSAPNIASAVAAPASSGPSPVLIIAAVAGGLALVAIIAAILLLTGTSGKCDATVRIVSPQNGTTVREPTPIRVEVEGAKCIERVIYKLDQEEIIKAETAPFDVMLDPAEIPGARPGNHYLSIVVEDEDGNKQLQKESIVIAFDAGAGAGPTTSDTPPPLADGQTTTDGGQTSGASVSTVDVREFCMRLAKEFSSKTEYRYDSAFLRQVQERTSEYAVEGFYERARPFRDTINSSFINEQGLDQPLGYVLAMSHSRFVLTKAGSARAGDATAEGLWQMKQSLAESNGYSGRCGTETLSDQSQRCAALVAAAYSKALFVSLFEGDFLYGVACFGMSPKDAGKWREGLPQERSDFWKVIDSPEKRERVVRFFAAGIVGENPQKFGLLKDRPLASLYPKK